MPKADSSELDPTAVYWEEFGLALQEFFMSLNNWRQNPNRYSR
jgi:hypothetical protein